ncbi:LytR C-terminal domain-containing protein [Actinomyces sp. W5033]|uniref:LytR C-terminal domain-containing protein n=1 Tax=Actinomyces sp. W5033 TaxID=3446479 RepID=UPI003EE1272B
MSQYAYPEDEFDAKGDDGTVPVGVHRAPVPAWRSWLPLLLIIIIVPLLAWGAVAVLGSRSALPSSVTGTAPAEATQDTATPEPSATAQTQAPAEPETGAPTEQPAAADLTTRITVHNGTATNGLAARTADRLSNAGYTSVTVSPGAYQESEPAVTTIYYSAPEHAATAQAAAEALGIASVVEDPAMAVSNPLVIVLRDDFLE